VVVFREAYFIHPFIQSIHPSIHLKLYEAKTLPAEMPIGSNNYKSFCPSIHPSVRHSSMDGIIQGRKPSQMSPNKEELVRFPII
jgi:hypothetical protein